VTGGAPEDTTATILEALWRAAPEPSPADTAFQERRLEEAIVTTLGDIFGPDRVVARGGLPGVTLPGWDPQPGAFDVAVTHADGSPRALLELKVDDIEHALWDLAKLAAASRLESVESAVVAVAAPGQTWRSRRDGVELFAQPAAGEGMTRDWSTRFFFTAYSKAWEAMYRQARARPVRLPETTYLGWGGDAPLAAFAGYELRVLTVSGADDTLALVDGWPLPRVQEPPLPPLIDDATLRFADVPAPDASEDEIQRFALTTNGYERLGTFDRCATLANSALEVWRREQLLPETLGELRCCLFFEQRRWRHFGYPFDDETLAYVRALIAKIRDLLAHLPS